MLIETATAPVWAGNRLQAAGVTVVRDADPVALPKACKNAVELEGIRNAHRRDGAAVSRFLGWLGARIPGRQAARDRGVRPPSGAAPESGELARSQLRHHLRRRPQRRHRALHASKATERTLEPGTLYLVDWGGQYLDGTTDITRTVASARRAPEMRDRFTRVLKGHIALATARFPAGTTGSQLDALAR